MISFGEAFRSARTGAGRRAGETATASEEATPSALPADSAPPADPALTCQRCGFPVLSRPWGCKNPCANCGTVYPLGDCSD